MNALATVALWAAALGSGLMAGIYFAFSTFIMTSLAAIDREQAVAAMQSINTKILSSLFMPLFWGTSALSVGLGVWAATHWSRPGAGPLLAASLVYFLGMFVCTAAGNVPLNNALDAVAPASEQAAAVWSVYLRDWTRYNHVRTVACTVSCALFIWAITRAA